MELKLQYLSPTCSRKYQLALKVPHNFAEVTTVLEKIKVRVQFPSYQYLVVVTLTLVNGLDSAGLTGFSVGSTLSVLTLPPVYTSQPSPAPSSFHHCMLAEEERTCSDCVKPPSDSARNRKRIISPSQ